MCARVTDRMDKHMIFFSWLPLSESRSRFDFFLSFFLCIFLPHLSIGSISAFEHLRTYPSPNPTLTRDDLLSIDCGWGRGGVGVQLLQGAGRWETLGTRLILTLTFDLLCYAICQISKFYLIHRRSNFRLYSRIRCFESQLKGCKKLKHSLKVNFPFRSKTWLNLTNNLTLDFRANYV